MTAGTMADVQSEEREVLARHRRLERARAKAAKVAERAWRQRLREAARETRARHPRCRCDFRGVQTRQELTGMVGCCDPMFVCPRLDAVRRKMGF